MFGFGEIASASVGRLLQGAGSAFAFVGTVYVVTKHTPARYLAFLIGITQMFGMLGGSAGQAPLSHLLEGHSLHWQDFWIYAGVLGCTLAGVLVLVLPSDTSRSSVRTDVRAESRGSMFSTYRVVFSNPRSWSCGLIAGLLFVPTTIGAMIWGVSFLSNGYGMAPAAAADIVALVPLGWVIGCPLLGFVADRIGRRKPVLIGGGLVALGAQLVILYVDMAAVPSSLWYSAFLLLGVASGAAMIPYTIIKEANPDEVKGSATAALNFLNFSCSAALAPVFGWLLLSVSGVLQPEALTLADFRLGLAPIPLGILAAIVIAMAINETEPVRPRERSVGHG
jgi:MFS family permease